MNEAEQQEPTRTGRALVVAREIVADLDETQRSVLLAWAQELVAIRAAKVGRIRKTAAAIRASTRKETTVALLSSIHGPLKKAGYKSKQLLWDDRNWASRLALSGVSISLAVGGAEAGAGIAALGGAIGVPLWLVLGSGGAFLGTLIEELRPLLPKGTDSVSVDIDWGEADRLIDAVEEHRLPTESSEVLFQLRYVDDLRARLVKLMKEPRVRRIEERAAELAGGDVDLGPEVLLFFPELLHVAEDAGVIKLQPEHKELLTSVRNLVAHAGRPLLNSHSDVSRLRDVRGICMGILEQGGK